MNVNLAYLIGVYLSDGSAHRTGRNWIVSLTAKDKDFVEETSRVVGELLGKTIPIYAQEYLGKSGMWKFSAYSKDLVLYLWDITNHKDKIPESITEGDLYTKLSFVAGYLDGDGFVSHNKNNQYQIGFTGTKDWVRDLLPNILASLGMKTNKVTTNWPKTQFKANFPLHRVTVNVHSFVAAGGHSRVGRKEKRLQTYYSEHQQEFSEAEKQLRYKRRKEISSPSETIGFYGNA